MEFNDTKIAHAIMMSFLEVEGQASIASASTRDKVEKMTKAVVAALLRHETASVSYTHLTLPTKRIV